MRMSPQPSQVWGFLPSSTVTCNIYKPLKRINLGGSGRAALPITSTSPSGFVTMNLMDLCDVERFQSCCSGTRPSLEPGLPSAAQRRAEARGLSWGSTSPRHCSVSAAPLLQLQPTHLLQERWGSASGSTDYCEVETYVFSMPLLSSLRSCIKTGLALVYSCLFRGNSCWGVK